MGRLWSVSGLPVAMYSNSITERGTNARLREPDLGRVIWRIDPMAEPSADVDAIVKSGLHSRGGRLSCTLTKPVNDLDLEISLVMDEGLEWWENGVLERPERPDR